MQKKSFTLLEITVASVVFAVAILSTLAALSVNFRLQASNKETLLAINAANEKLNIFLTDPLIFRKLNDGLLFLTLPNTDLTNPYDWGHNLATQVWDARFQVPGVNIQPGDLTFCAGSISINCYSVAPGLPPAGIDYFEIIVLVRWTGVSGNRRVVVQSQRFRLKEDADIQTIP
ncbi:MAG: type II secretion system protein [Planctomycetota bacterium]